MITLIALSITLAISIGINAWFGYHHIRGDYVVDQDKWPGA